MDRSDGDLGTGLPDGSRGPHFFVADLARPALSDADRHHAEKALRVSAGDAMTVADGDGSWREVRFGPELEPVTEPVFVEPPSADLRVGFALVKGSKPELVVQKLTELGIDQIMPFVAERSIVRWDEAKMDKARARWVAVARSAAMQSRRVRLPRVDDVASFEKAATSDSVLADRGGRPPTSDDVSVLVGPEGGWAPDELAAGLERVGFGVNVMRAETAALAVGSVLAVLRAGLVGPAA